MSNDTTHTELPWKTSEEYSDCGGKYTAIDGKHYNDEVLGQSGLRSKEDAAFIVQACNNHYQLLEALKTVMSHIHFDRGANCETIMDGGWGVYDKAKEVIKQAEEDVQ